MSGFAGFGVFWTSGLFAVAVFRNIIHGAAWVDMCEMGVGRRLGTVPTMGTQFDLDLFASIHLMTRMNRCE